MRSFIRTIYGLILASLVSMALHLLLCILFPKLNAYHKFYVFCLLLWLGYGIFIFYLAHKAVNSNQINKFTRLILISVMLKLILGILVMVGYNYSFHPLDSYYAIPFLQTYLIFTIFETYQLMKIGRGRMKT